MKCAKDVMVKEIKVIRVSDSVQTACKILIKNKISGTPVVDKSKRLVGFVSEKDIIKFLSRPKSAKKKIKDIMTKRVTSVDENASLNFICKIFSEKAYRRLPVTAKGKLIGIINRANIMDSLLSEHY